ncbi:MAG TPA: mucoidy inhibitor MuiA family protein [Opitutaceae bacterium]|nr:mucoidy inhibitor MuiA family protein [Opitutaceae bacterium]
MKTLRPTLLLVCFITALRAAPVESRITAVTVYTEGAIVTRTAHLDLPAGQTELAFENLPAALVDESLQVSGHGTAGVTILDVTARTTFVAAPSDPRVKAIEDSITALEKKVRLLDDRGAVLDHQRTLLGKIEDAVAAPPAKDTAAPRPSFDDWQKLLAFADDNRSKFAAEQQSLDEQRQALQDQITAAGAQLGNLTRKADPGHSNKTVTVHVAAASAGSLDLTLAYAVPGASWTPTYDARLHSDEHTVELTYFGLVRQSTGEDWKDIALTLSTAEPSLGGEAPELNPWIVDVVKPEPAPTSASGGDDTIVIEKFQVSAAPSRGYSASETMAGSRIDRKASYNAASVDNTVTSASFTIPVAATIPSDNTAQKVGIATATLDAKLQYQSTPRALEAAFLSASAADSTDYPLLAGDVNAFLDDSFVATSSLKTVMPGAKFELAFGADEGIAIKRKVVNRFTEDTGLISKGKRVTYEFLVTITNNKKTAQHIVLKDLVPVSRNEKLVVKLLTPAEGDLSTADEPKEASLEAEGKLVWRLDLKPGEKRELPLKFSVEYPSDIAVTGLE